MEKNNRSLMFIVLILLFLIAIIDSIYLTYHHYLVNILNPEMNSFCSINDLINCDRVAVSKFSTMFGLPVSSLGIFAYTFLFLISIWSYNRTDVVSKIYSLSYLILVIMFLFSMYEFLASILIIKSLCIMCSVLYITCLLLLIVMKKSFVSKTHKELIFEFKDIVQIVSDKIVIILLLLIISIITSTSLTIGIRSYFTSMSELKKQNSELEFTKSTEAMKRERFMDTYKISQYFSSLNLQDSPHKGHLTAYIKMVIFSDFQCGACKSFGNSIEELLIKHSDNFVVFYKNSPFDSSCHPEVKETFHHNSCFLSYIGHCAHRQNKFWPVHDYLFNYNGKIDEMFVEKVIKEFQFNEVKFKKCMKEDAKKMILHDIEEAVSLNINYTPTVFINGKRVSDFLISPEDYDLMIQILKDTIKTEL